MTVGLVGRAIKCWIHGGAHGGNSGALGGANSYMFSLHGGGEVCYNTSPLHSYILDLKKSRFCSLILLEKFNINPH